MDASIYRTVHQIGLSKKDIDRVFRALEKTFEIPSWHVVVHVVGTERMRGLNRTHRGKDCPTDVLSFPTEPWTDNFVSSDDDLGDVFLCPRVITRQAREHGISSREEHVRMLTHGILHLLGFDHVKKNDADMMFAVQEDIVGKCSV